MAEHPGESATAVADLERKLKACGRGWRKDREAIREQVMAALRYVETDDGHGVIVLRDLLRWLEQATLVGRETT